MVKKILLVIGLTVALFTASWYLSLHTSHYVEKIVLMGEGDTLLIIDASRTSILGIYYSHEYSLEGYISGIKIVDGTQFISFKREVSPYGFLKEFQDIHEYENTKRSIAGHILSHGKEIYFISENLTADMTMKTHPDYFRYGSFGEAKGQIEHQNTQFQLMLVTTVLHDGKYATLNPGSEADGFVGTFWENGNPTYFDRSYIRKYGVGEEYYAHNFGFQKIGSGVTRLEGINIVKDASGYEYLQLGEKNITITRKFPGDSDKEDWNIIEGPSGKGYLNRWMIKN